MHKASIGYPKITILSLSFSDLLLAGSSDDPTLAFVSTAWRPWRSVLPVECLFLHGSGSHHRSTARADTHSASESTVLHRTHRSRRCTSPKWCFSQEIPFGRATLAPRPKNSRFTGIRPTINVLPHWPQPRVPHKPTTAGQQSPNLP